jgi:hypothetical protein
MSRPRRCSRRPIRLRQTCPSCPTHPTCRQSRCRPSRHRRSLCRPRPLRRLDVRPSCHQRHQLRRRVRRRRDQHCSRRPGPPSTHRSIRLDVRSIPLRRPLRRRFRRCSSRRRSHPPSRRRRRYPRWRSRSPRPTSTR